MFRMFPMQNLGNCELQITEVNYSTKQLKSTKHISTVVLIKLALFPQNHQNSKNNH